MSILRKMLTVLLAALLLAGCSQEGAPADKQGATPHKQEPKPQRGLYDRAVLAKAPAYEVAYSDKVSAGRTDVFIITARTEDKAALGSILICEQEESGTDLVSGYYFESRGAVNRNEIFAYGHLAATAKGKSYITGEQELSKVGEFPVLTIEVY